MTEEATTNENIISASKDLGSGEVPDLRKASITFNFGASVEEAVELFGADVVLSNFKRAATITAQAAMRRMLEDGKSEAEIQDTMSAWKPGVALQSQRDPVSATLAKFGSMTAEEQQELIAKLQAKANG